MERTILRLPDDERLAELELHLRSRLAGRVSDLKLCLRDAALVLNGVAHSYFGKQLAQHLAIDAAPTLVVVNEIEVR